MRSIAFYGWMMERDNTMLGLRVELFLFGDNAHSMRVGENGICSCGWSQLISHKLFWWIKLVLIVNFEAHQKYTSYTTHNEANSLDLNSHRWLLWIYRLVVWMSRVVYSPTSVLYRMEWLWLALHVHCHTCALQIFCLNTIDKDISPHRRYYWHKVVTLAIFETKNYRYK